MQRSGVVAGAAVLLALAGPAANRALAQHQTALSPPGDSQPAPHRQRLILKDGTFQIVMSYRVLGQRVVYISAERGGEAEEIPLQLVDLAATQRWEAAHGPGAKEKAEGEAAGQDAGQTPVLSPELQKEEADRAALTPVVAPNLKLDPQDNVLALDVFRGTPELVPLLQSSSDLSRNAEHNILKGMINPRSATHQIVLLKGQASDVQMHVPDPVFYLRTDDAQIESGTALTVDTHGASRAAERKPKPSASEYVLVRVDVREGARVVASFNTSSLGTTRQEANIIDSVSTPLPSGHWLKITPARPLLIGEYALIEVLGDNQINLGVWDFGVHPTAPENRDVKLPEKPGSGRLAQRPQ